MAEAFAKRWPTEKELVSVNEGILRLRKIVERVCCVKPNPAQWKGPKDMPLTNPIRHKMMGGAPAH